MTTPAKSPRMTTEELNALKPSIDNPIELTCDTGGYIHEFRIVSVISPVINSCLCVIDTKGNYGVISSEALKNYPSLKKPVKLKRYWLWTYEAGAAGWKRSNHYYDDAGRGTSGHQARQLAESMQASTAKKHENEFIDIEVEG